MRDLQIIEVRYTVINVSFEVLDPSTAVGLAVWSTGRTTWRETFIVPAYPYQISQKKVHFDGKSSSFVEGKGGGKYIEYIERPAKDRSVCVM